MKQNFLWIVFGFLFIIFFVQLLFTTKIVSKEAFFNINQKVAGIAKNMPEPDRNALRSPPEKRLGASDPQIYAKSVILIDVNSSYVMYAKNSQEKMPIASTTKIMTAMVVLDNYQDKLTDVVTITYPMIAVEGSDIKLVPGEKITVENLLNGLLIMSGNDTAFALAIHFGGKEAFVNEMNKKANNLGLYDTEFKDPAGLDDEGYSTARDLAFLASYAMRNDKFRQIVKTSENTISSVDGAYIHELKSSNRMVKPDEFLYFQYALGIKTGFTYAAGHCLISAAQKDGHEILGVVLNTIDNSITASASESRKLLDWGFSNWIWH